MQSDETFARIKKKKLNKNYVKKDIILENILFHLQDEMITMEMENSLFSSFSNHFIFNFELCNVVKCKIFPLAEMEHFCIKILFDGTNFLFVSKSFILTIILLSS